MKGAESEPERLKRVRLRPVVDVSSRQPYGRLVKTRKLKPLNVIFKIKVGHYQVTLFRKKSVPVYLLNAIFIAAIHV